MKILKTNVGRDIDLNKLKDVVDEYTDIPDIKIIRARDIQGYLTDNPTHYVYNGDNTFLTNIGNHVCKITSSSDVDPKGFRLTPENVMDEWAVLEPVSFMRAIRAWDSGAHILQRSDDLLPCMTYVQDGKLNRDDLHFDVIEILVHSWFKYIRK